MRPIKTVRESGNKILLGVCGGLAYAFGVSVWQMRILFFVLFFGSSSISFFYLMLAFVLPQWEKDPEDYREVV